MNTYEGQLEQCIQLRLSLEAVIFWEREEPSLELLDNEVTLRSPLDSNFAEGILQEWWTKDDEYVDSNRTQLEQVLSIEKQYFNEPCNSVGTFVVFFISSIQFDSLENLSIMQM